MRPIDPISLQMFLSTIAEGSISRAAKRENVVSSAVSKRIADLEQALGVELLVRSPSGVSPTPAGSALVERGWSVLRELEDLRLEMVDYAKGTRGHVRVRASATALAMNAVNDLREFIEKERGVTVDLAEQFTPLIIEDIRSATADIGIVMDICRYDGAITYPYLSTSLSVVIPASHPLAGRNHITYKEALYYEQVESPAASGIAQFLDLAAQALQVKKRVKMRATSYENICRMVASGMGLGVVPTCFKETCERPLQLRFISLSDTWATIPISIIIKEGARLNSATQTLLDFVRARGLQA